MSNIVILTGSAHKNGCSSLLAQRFERGAKSSGSSVLRFDMAFLNINECKGCNFCKSSGGLCRQKDDFEMVSEAIVASSAVVFVTPLYYFGMSAALKAAVDRFHALSAKIRQAKSKDAFLIVAQASALEDTAEALVMHYRKIIDYLNWENRGILIAKSSATVQDLLVTDYPLDAEKMGRTIK